MQQALLCQGIYNVYKAYSTTTSQVLPCLLCWSGLRLWHTHG